MKLLLSWLLDHIDTSKKDIDIPSLVSQFTATTAEVDGSDTITTELACMAAADVVEQTDATWTVQVPEWHATYTLPARNDACRAPMTRFLVYKGDTPRWVTLHDVGSSKDGLMPPLYIPDEQVHGGWRDEVEQVDTCIVVDNKALTNRPDLWGHRGCAREMAALLGKHLVGIERFLKEVPTTATDEMSLPQGDNRFALEVSSLSCRRLSALYVSSVTYRASLPSIAFRLARVDVRPINALVDMTNYVMCDISQPMHAFDGSVLSTARIEARMARPGEHLTLLDGEAAELTSDDCVITSGDVPVSLAGIMGGSASGVTSASTSLLLESGNFEPTAIRLTAARLKKRSEASARFEKNLDPTQVPDALKRYVALLDAKGVPYTITGNAYVVGPALRPKTLAVSHTDLEQKIGMQLTHERVIEILERLDFGVVFDEGIYTATVPTFRATKDVTIPEDIVEEVARFVGYSTIVPTLPKRAMSAFDTSTIERKRRLKHIVAYGLSMHEAHTYAFYDEEFLRELKYEPQDTLEVANPLSQHWKRLITSLIPNLIKCVVTNKNEQQTLRFFELNRVWFFKDGPVESQEVAGIWYEHKEPIDFYSGKELVSKVCDALHMPITWRSHESAPAPWYDQYQSAELWYGDRIIGRAGKASRRFLEAVLEGDAFFFELDANVLLQSTPEQTTFVPLAKYPTTHQDISLLVPLSVTVAGLESTIAHADTRITDVELVDHFQKAEWLDKKSLTFRYTAADPQGTLTKDAIEAIWRHVHAAVTALGAEVR